MSSIRFAMKSMKVARILAFTCARRLCKVKPVKDIVFILFNVDFPNLVSDVLKVQVRFLTESQTLTTKNSARADARARGITDARVDARARSFI